MKHSLSPWILSVLGACTVPPYPALAIENDTEQVAQVIVGDTTLQAILRAGRPLVERLHPDESLRVVVPIRNIDLEPIQVLAQLAFLDAEQRPLPDETNRQVLTVPAGGTQNFEAVSRDARAVDFVLRLHWNK